LPQAERPEALPLLSIPPRRRPRSPTAPNAGSDLQQFSDRDARDRVQRAWPAALRPS
jgi:hypothetical protein